MRNPALAPRDIIFRVCGNAQVATESRDKAVKALWLRALITSAVGALCIAVNACSYVGVCFERNDLMCAMGMD